MTQIIVIDVKYAIKLKKKPNTLAFVAYVIVVLSAIKFIRKISQIVCNDFMLFGSLQ